MLFTFIDVETSGLSVIHDDVLSFSFATYESSTREIIRSATLYFYKEGVTKWTEEAYQIHKLSREFLKQFESEFDSNIRLMYTVIQDSIFVGYNSGRKDPDGKITGFDYNIIKNFLSRNGYSMPEVEAFVDVMQVAKKEVHKEGQKFRLQTIIDHLGISRGNIDRVAKVCFPEGQGEAHESGYDVVCTIMLFDYFFSRKMIHFVRESDKYKPKSANDFIYRIVDGELFAILKSDPSIEYDLFQLFNSERTAFSEKFPFLL